MTSLKNTTRNLKARVKTARGRSISSVSWLARQLNDPYVQQAKEQGYRSRAAYKLLEIDAKFKFLLKGKIVIDLGAAPGGWTQVAVAKVKPATTAGKVISIDLMDMGEIKGAIFLKKDFLTQDAEDSIIEHLGGRKADIVLSDMAAASCGHAKTDHLRIIALCEAAYQFALQVLAEDGVFVAKILKGGTEHQLLAALKKDFKIVKHFKPPASRPESAESYVIAMGFRGF